MKNNMYCSCPYTLDGRNCKHMAAVLYEWSENEIEEKENEVNTDLFGTAYAINDNKKKQAAVEKIVSDAKEEDVRSFLVSVLTEDEKLLLRFHGIVNKQVTKENIKGEALQSKASRYFLKQKNLCKK